MNRTWTSAGLLAFLLACGDSGSGSGSGGDTGTTGGGGEGGTGGVGTGGGGAGTGGAGGGLECPMGSHPEGESCVAVLGEFAAGPELKEARDHHMTWITTTATGSYLYAAGGGQDMSKLTPSFERSKLNEDGSMSPWTTLTTEAAVLGAGVVAEGKTVVFTGGLRSPGGASGAVDVYTVNDDGELSEPEDGPAMAVERFHGASVLAQGHIFAVGGLDQDGTGTKIIESIALKDGALGPTWKELEPLELGRSHEGLATDGTYLYITGGIYRENNNFQDDVLYDDVLVAKASDDGTLSTWTHLEPLPRDLAVHSSFVFAGELYLVGGISGFQFVDTVYHAKILDDGDLGPWELSEVKLPIRRGHSHQTPIHEGWLYSVAGHNAGTSQTETFFARFQ